MLGPTNTGKTHQAIEQMLSHRSGMIGLPLRLLAREIYDRITARIGEDRVALITGEEKRVPPRPQYWVCTVESMPLDRDVDFLCVDEIQLAAHAQRGHAFTDRLLHARGVKETWFLGSDPMRPMIERLTPTALIRRNPRLSKLSYAGVQSLSAIPPRTAVVAFSVAQVYELAEHIRQRHGGAAVVLGALSPRTRNAQVAMFEAGEVDYMVATDAIGMGLNLDLDRVMFGALRKFDGKESRALHTRELAQIAGRAGRFTTDGAFGVLKPLPGLDPRDATAIEQHDFPPLSRLVWRSPDLDFTSIPALLESLRVRPRTKMLRLVQQADDHDVLAALARVEAVHTRARDPATIELLWDVCRVPDFRKLLLESHARLLADIFVQLSDDAQIDEDWMATRVNRLDDTNGDIEALMNRIAFIRTWTYVSNQERWVRQAKHWQERTREIEDRCSDALHERLTARFVDEVGTREVRRRSRRRAAAVAKGATPVAADSPFSALAGLVVEDEDDSGAADETTDAIVAAGHRAFAVELDGSIRFEGRLVGRLVRASEITKPDVIVDFEEDAPGAGASRRIQRRLTAWARDAVARLWPAGCAELSEQAKGPLRGLLYSLQEQLGTVDAKAARAQLNALDAGQRKMLDAAGVELGRQAVWVRGAHRGSCLRLRYILCRVFLGADIGEFSASRVSLREWDAVASIGVERLGFVVCGPRAVRADVLESSHSKLCDLATAADPFALPAAAASWFGCSKPELPAILAELGIRRVSANSYSFSARRRGRSRRRRHP